MEAVQRAEEQEEEDEAQEELDGGIVSMHLRNFFCHENLEIRFNRNVNFIVGRNGSGKSAVLTALVVGLGARASATNRGNALHAFIKKGANSATVEIKIKNSSAKAFKHHLYGDYITIVRHITASGATNYKAKAASGEVVSTKLEEVHAITLAHDIQVDNPISVLNQDEARNFHASDAKKKFALFRKATNLDQTESNYRRALENLNKAKSIWGRKKEAYTDLEKELMKWEQIYEHLQSHEEVVAREKRLQDEFYWSDVEEFQKEVTTIQAQYDKQNNRVQKLLDKLQSMEQNFGSNNDTIESMKEQLKEKTHKRKALEEELSQLSSGLREVQTEWRSVQHRLSKQNDLVKREKKKVQDLEKEITNINTGSAAEKRAELERAVRVAEQAAEVVHARYDTAQNDASQAQQHMQRAQAAADQSFGRMQHHQDKLKHLKMQLRELDSRGTDSLAVYGNMMVELKQKIQEATARKQFSEPPRGPVGSYIKVKDKKWAGSLEHIIGGSMKTFCVNTPEDSRRLFEIMRQVYGTAAKPGVTCSKFLPKQHNVSRNKVCAAGYVSALDSMDISDPVIANFLIDNVGVESILLVPDHDDAVRLSDDVENVPQNCSKIVTLDGTEYHPAPNYRSYGGAGRPSRFLQVSTQERRKQVQMEMAQVEREVEEARKVAEECARESEHAVQAERDAARTLHALLRARHEKDAAKQRAADELQMLQAPHHQVLVEELDVSKEKLLSLENDLKQTAERDNGYKQRMDTCEANINAVKQKLGKVAQTISKLTEEIGQEQLKLDQGITRRQTYMQQIREDQDILSELLRRLDESKAQLEEKSTAALALCPRVDNPRERATVAHELKKLQVKLRSMRTEGLNKQEVAAKLLDVRRKHNTTKYMLNKIEALIEEAKQTSREHLNYCSSVQTFIARRVQYCFQSILTLRGYSGRMEIDDTRGVLEIWCTGRESSQKRIAATTSSLSGGERSYSTVAFIMALWECVELPFYFMDEFDVFMDNVNRKIIMELLVDHALKNTNRQFVFLTPQDASSVTAGPNIKIHRMADPRRD